MLLTDSHCHLDFHAFDQDRHEVVDRAHEQGVERILSPGIDLETSRAVSGLVKEFPQVYAAVGIHPNIADQWNDEVARELVLLASHEKVVAIGEIGLDYYRLGASEAVQRQAFIGQLELANQSGLPVVIHSRNPGDGSQLAVSDVLDILGDWQADLKANNSELAGRPGVLHSFSGSIEHAYTAIELGFFIGITGPVTFQNARELQAIVGELPLSSLLIETDSPFLSPHPHRGSRNEPARVRLVADKIAGIKNQPNEVVYQATSSNAERLFRWQVIL